MLFRSVSQSRYTKASATISLGNLSQTYDGTARTVTATTSPSNLPTTITYNGASSAQSTRPNCSAGVHFTAFRFAPMSIVIA